MLQSACDDAHKVSWYPGAFERLEKFSYAPMRLLVADCCRDFTGVRLVAAIVVPFPVIAFFAQWLEVLDFIATTPRPRNLVVDDEDDAVREWGTSTLGATSGCEDLCADTLTDRRFARKCVLCPPSAQNVAVLSVENNSGHIEVLAEAAHATVDLRIRLAKLGRCPGADLYHCRRIRPSAIEEAIDGTSGSVVDVRAEFWASRLREGLLHGDAR
jgi:hypothetical protein